MITIENVNEQIAKLEGLTRRNDDPELIKFFDKNRIMNVGGFQVETWFDKQGRNWTTQVKDSNGCQIGHAEYAGFKSWGAYNHVSRVIETCYEILSDRYNLQGGTK
jgi:hypothetical protein